MVALKVRTGGSKGAGIIIIPKGKRIDSYSDEQIAQIEVWCNSLPRKTLGYQTPDEMFEAEIDRIYGMAA